MPLSVVENDFKTIRSKTSDLSEDVVSYDHIVSTVATTAAKQKNAVGSLDREVDLAHWAVLPILGKR